MWSKLGQWFLKSKAAKISGGALGSGAFITLFLALHSDLTGRIESAEARTRSYADTKHEMALREVTHLKGDHDEIKALLQKIDKRVYDLKKSKN